MVLQPPTSLAQTGRRVLVLEQHYIAGGVHILLLIKRLNMKLEYTKGSINKYKPLFELLGDDEIEWCQLGHEDPQNMVYDEIIVDDQRFRLPAGKENIINYLLKDFQMKNME